MKYIVLTTLKYNGETYYADSLIELSAEDGRELSANGIVKPVRMPFAYAAKKEV